MRNSINITRPYQFGFMIVRHLLAVLICAIFEAMTSWYYLDKPLAAIIIGSVFSLVYGLYIYSSARRLSVWDAKSYTPLKSEVKWGIFWGIAIAATVAAALIIYYFNWTHFSSEATINTGEGAVTEQGFTNIFCVVVNFIMYIWLAPYFGFAKTPYGFPAYAMFLMLAIPVIASALGYISGKKNFDLIQKLDAMTFEQEDEDDED